MSSAATTTFHLAAPPAAVIAAVERVIVEHRFTSGERAFDGSGITFVTRKTMLSWELHATVAATTTSDGSLVMLSLDTVAGRPWALLDGKKNQKSAEKLVRLISDAVA